MGRRNGEEATMQRGMKGWQGLGAEPAGPGRLVRAAADGSAAAWDELVGRYDDLLRSVATSYRIGHADAADVVQLAWLRLYENLGRIREPDRVVGWLVTTVRRECLRVLRRSGRQVLCADPADGVEGGVEPAGDAAVLEAERSALVRAAIDTLPTRSRELLRLLFDGERSYDEISALLRMPVGSIGPTRQRCLAQLRRQLESTAAA